MSIRSNIDFADKAAKDLSAVELRQLLRDKELEYFKKRFVAPTMLVLTIYGTMEYEETLKANIVINPDGTWEYS